MSNNQRYSRFTMEEPVDDEDQENGVDAPLEIAENDDVSMQEGRRVLGMMANNTNLNSDMKMTKIASIRLICILILWTMLVFGIGALIGFAAVNDQKTTKDSNFSTRCPDVFTSTPSTSTPTTRNDSVPATDAPAKPDIPKMSETIEDISSTFLSQMSPNLIKKYTQSISKLSSGNLRKYIVNAFKSFSFTVQEKMFPVMASVPDSENPNIVEIVRSDGTSQVINNATESLKGFFPYNAFSPNGTVNASLLYAHYGTKKDFKILSSTKVNISGSILLMRVGRIHPSVKVRNAVKYGAVAILFYPDPFDFGGGSGNPESRLPDDGIVWQSLRASPGDPSTPHYSSQRNVFRISPSKYSGMSPIIAQPVSSETGRFLFQILEGPEIPTPWLIDFLPATTQGIRGVGGSFKGKVNSIRITSNNLIEERLEKVVIAFPPAKDQTKVIHVGCHYEIKNDHVTSTGISLASMLAMAEALSASSHSGTERLVIFTIFESKFGDAAAGTEYAQLFSWWLDAGSLAYIDFDSVLKGVGYLEANVSPVLRDTVRKTFNQVAWVGGKQPNILPGVDQVTPFQFNSAANRSEEVKELFSFGPPYTCDESINYVSLHGIPSIQISSVSINKSDAFFMGHSQYDSMEILQLQDRDFLWTNMIVSSLGVAATILSSYFLPPVRFSNVGHELVNEWNNFMQENKENYKKGGNSVLDLIDDIDSALKKFSLNCESYDDWYGSDEYMGRNSTLASRLREIENRLWEFLTFGRRFLRPRGVEGPGSDFGSLLTFGPSMDDPCQGEYFASIRRALHDALGGQASMDMFKKELSLLHSALVDFRTFKTLT